VWTTCAYFVCWINHDPLISFNKGGLLVNKVSIDNRVLAVLRARVMPANLYRSILYHLSSSHHHRVCNEEVHYHHRCANRSWRLSLSSSSVASHLPSTGKIGDGSTSDPRVRLIRGLCCIKHASLTNHALDETACP